MYLSTNEAICWLCMVAHLFWVTYKIFNLNVEKLNNLEKDQVPKTAVILGGFTLGWVCTGSVVTLHSHCTWE